MTESLCGRPVTPDVPPAECRACGGCIKCCQCEPATVTTLAPRMVARILAGAEIANSAGDQGPQPDGAA